MALCQHGTASSSSSELREFIITEDESAIGDNISIFEPLSDSCGESDMEGLDFSLFEPQVEPNCCHKDSRVYSGILDLLMHYCGKQILEYKRVTLVICLSPIVIIN